MAIGGRVFEREKLEEAEDSAEERWSWDGGGSWGDWWPPWWAYELWCLER